MGSTIIWTDEERRICIELAKEGWSGSQIAARVGRKKNSVVGFLFRAGVRLLGNVNKTPKDPSAKPPRKRKPFSPAVRAEEIVVPIIKPERREGFGPVPFIEGRFDQCQWITEDSTKTTPAMICGEAVTKFGCRWCKEHYDIVFVPRSAHKKIVGQMDYAWNLKGTK
jgi:hypothetical protein